MQTGDWTTRERQRYSTIDGWITGQRHPTLHPYRQAYTLTRTQITIECIGGHVSTYRHTQRDHNNQSHVPPDSINAVRPNECRVSRKNTSFCMRGNDVKELSARYSSWSTTSWMYSWSRIHASEREDDHRNDPETTRIRKLSKTPQLLGTPRFTTPSRPLPHTRTHSTHAQSAAPWDVHG